LGLVSDSAESARRPFTAAYLASSVGVARPAHLVARVGATATHSGGPTWPRPAPPRTPARLRSRAHQGPGPRPRQDPDRPDRRPRPQDRDRHRGLQHLAPEPAGHPRRHPRRHRKVRLRRPDRRVGEGGTTIEGRRANDLAFGRMTGRLPLDGLLARQPPVEGRPLESPRRDHRDRPVSLPGPASP